MNNQIRIIDRKPKVNSKGTIVGRKCVDTLILVVDCVTIQNIIYRADIKLIQEWGFETSKNYYRFDFRLSTPIDITPTMYIQYIDPLGELHEYKIIKVFNRSILGCLWITLYGDNFNPRDYKEIVHNRDNVTAF